MRRTGLQWTQWTISCRLRYAFAKETMFFASRPLNAFGIDGMQKRRVRHDTALHIASESLVKTETGSEVWAISSSMTTSDSANTELDYCRR